MKKIIGLIVGLLLLTGCSNIAIVSSGSSLALSNNAYAKAYSGIDFATAITTKKDIKTHAYEYIVKAREVKKTFVNIVAPSVERKTFKVDESIKLASTKNERVVFTIDVFTICYLSFFLAVAIVLLAFSLIYLVIHCCRKPKKIKKKKLKRKKRK
tara:strand:- start:42 stop:506 length:465 start_codon:yes stop_codon:yes gene_type:complete